MLEEAMTSHSQTASKLADATGVPERFIAAIIEGNFGILPAAPMSAVISKLPPS